MPTFTEENTCRRVYGAVALITLTLHSTAYEHSSDDLTRMVNLVTWAFKPISFTLSMYGVYMPMFTRISTTERYCVGKWFV